MTQIVLSFDPQEANDLLTALKIAEDALHRSPCILDAKCLVRFHDKLWNAFKEQFIKETNPEFYRALNAVNSKEENQ